MRLSEKQRLIALTREAVKGFSNGNAQITARAVKASEKFSPTNAESYRELSHIVWWLIAADEYGNAMSLLNALCEVDGEYYWMYHALASSFAARAWLHSKQKDVLSAESDATTALRWLHRDPNFKAISRDEVKGSLERVDDWLDRADREKGTVTSLRVLAHAMRVIVMYQQIAEAGDEATKSIDANEFTSRLDLGLQKIRHLTDTW